MALVKRKGELEELVPSLAGDNRHRVELITDGLIGSKDLSGMLLTYHPGDRVPRHVHPQARHVLLGLTGVGTLHLDDEDLALQPGDVGTIGPGENHWFSNDTETDWTFVELVLPAPTETIWLEPGYTPEWVPAPNAT